MSALTLEVLEVLTLEVVSHPIHFSLRFVKKRPIIFNIQI